MSPSNSNVGHPKNVQTIYDPRNIADEKYWSQSFNSDPLERLVSFRNNTRV